MNSYYNHTKNQSANKVSILCLSLFSFCIAFMLLLSGCGGGSGGDGNNNAANNSKPADLDPAIESITLVSPTESGSIVLVAGFSQKLLVAGIDKKGTRRLLTAKDGLNFKIGESANYVTVSESGIISSKTKIPAKVFLTISLNKNLSIESIPVIIQDEKLESITIYANESSAPDITLPENFHVKIKAYGKFKESQTNSYKTHDISTYTGLWSSTNNNVAFESDTIFSTTLFSKASGDTKIIAKQGKIESSFPVHVIHAHLRNISISPNENVIPFKSKVQMQAVGYFTFESTSLNLDMTNNVLWSVQSPIASIDNSMGILTTYEAAGDIIVKATSNLGKTATSKLSIGNPVIESVYVTNKPGGFPIPSESKITIANGLTTNVYTYAIYSNGKTNSLDLNNKDNHCEWKHNDTINGQVEVTTMGNYSIVKGIKEGPTYFTLSCQNSQNNTIQFTTNVLVESRVIVGIDIDAGATTLPKGNSTPIALKAHYSDGTTGTISAKNAIWSSNPSEIISINPDTGLAIAESSGETMVKAEYDSANKQSIAPAYKKFEVLSAALKSISIELESTIIVSGTTQKIAAIGHFTDNTQHDISAIVDWHCPSPLQCSDNVIKAESVNEDHTVTISATDPSTGIKSESKHVIDVPVKLVSLKFYSAPGTTNCYMLGNSLNCDPQFFGVYNDGSSRAYKDIPNSNIIIEPAPNNISKYPKDNNGLLAFEYNKPPTEVYVTGTNEDGITTGRQKIYPRQ